MAVPPGVRRSWDARGEWGASTLGAPGESWDAIIAALHAVGATWLEVRAAPDALVHTGLTAAERSAVRARLAASGITTLAIASGVRLGAPKRIFFNPPHFWRLYARYLLQPTQKALA